jgi:hypothetical protein
MIKAVHEHLRAVVHGLGHFELAAIPEHGERLTQLVGSVPPAVWNKVSNEVSTRYHKLEARYGRPTALAIVSAGIVGTAVPLPGTTFVAVAPLIALAELHHKVATSTGSDAAPWAARIHLAESEVMDLGKQWMQDLAGLVNEE